MTPPQAPPPYDGGGSPTPPAQQTNPCDEIKNQNNNSGYRAKVKELKKKTNLKHESGFEESKDGKYKSLTPGQSTETSDNLTLSITSDTKGFIHTHLDSYEATNAAGEQVTRTPIKMFSPGDVDVLMALVDSNKNSGDFSKYYVSMVTSGREYILKFTGTKNDIKTGFGSSNWSKKYKEFMGHRFNEEKAFLTFLEKEMKVAGISLYKVKEDKAVKKELSSNGKTVIKVPC